MTTPQIQYFLGTYDNGHLKSVQVLTEMNYFLYSNHFTALKKLATDDSLFNIVELNYNDLRAKIDEYLLSYMDTHKADFYEFDEKISLNINRLL